MPIRMVNTSSGMTTEAYEHVMANVADSALGR